MTTMVVPSNSKGPVWMQSLQLVNNGTEIFPGYWGICIRWYINCGRNDAYTLLW